MKDGTAKRKGSASRQTVRPLRGADLPLLREQCEREGGRFVSVDLRSCVDRESALRELGRALNLPSWFGANLDALYDALTDLDGPCWVIAIELPKVSPRFDRSSRSALLAAFRDAAEYHSSAGRMLFRVLYS
jgi:RNAse (barnase) inhibitor barstar